ncbi:hydantoinase/carbamoylase family amidase (plasmid) [Mesorhizobium sp. INR15]|nr:hydantoinase/carbamoylase family amidase [Mesorhizobium sp. INR15]
MAHTPASDGLAEEFLLELERRTLDDPGVTRDAYGDGEAAGHALLAEFAARLELPVTVDHGGNMYAKLQGTSSEKAAWVIGSHLDSVPHGGNFDGAAGIAAGLAAIANIKRRFDRPERSVVLMAIRAEESTWFPASYIGSRAAFGLIGADELELPRKDTGRTLATHMLGAGLSPAKLMQDCPFLSPSAIRGFIEVHIEQGPTLILEDTPIAVVTAIAGSFRHREAVIRGAYGHSGAVARRHRHDAVFAFADLVSAIDLVWAELDASAEAATITFGEVGTDPQLHAFSKIPGELRFSLDVRSGCARTLDHISQALGRICREIEGRRGVRFDLGPLTGSTPAVLSTELQEALHAYARRRGIACLSLPSGAGHDAAVFAQQGVPTAMVFVRNDNGSHNPDEAMRFDDLDCAIAVLTDLVSERQASD